MLVSINHSQENGWFIVLATLDFCGKTCEEVEAIYKIHSVFFIEVCPSFWTLLSLRINYHVRTGIVKQRKEQPLIVGPIAALF